MKSEVLRSLSKGPSEFPEGTRRKGWCLSLDYLKASGHLAWAWLPSSDPGRPWLPTTAHSKARARPGIC